MLQDVNCPRCKHLFAVTEARHPVGVDCPKCEAGLTVEFRKRPAPIEPGDSPYEVLIEPGKPLAPPAAADAAPRKKLRQEDDEDGETGDAPGVGGSSFLVVFATLFAALLAIAGLGATGYFLFTNLDTSDAALNTIKPTPAPGATPGNRHTPGIAPGTTGVAPPIPPQPGKNPFELKPLTGHAPPIQEASLPAEVSVIALPSKVGAVAVGGAGRYVVLHFPERGLLGVLDASTGKIQAASADSGDVKLAAGLSRLATIVPNANIMRIYSLPDLRKLYDASTPVNGLGSIVMGSRTNGPLIGVGAFGGIHVMDVKDDGVREVEEGRRENLEMHWNGAGLRAAPDGTAYLTCDGYDKGRKARLAFVENRQWKKREFTLPFPFIGADGDLYGNGVVVNQLGVDQHAGGIGAGSGAWYVPAVCGDSGAFLKVVQSPGVRPGANKTVTVTIHKKGNADAPAEGTPVLSGLPDFEGLFDPWGNPANDRPLDRQLFLFPEARLLVIISGNKEKLTLRRVELR